MNTLVIGAGHNGLAAAFYLANAGLEPLVLEARRGVGGGAITTELHPGFRGPTLTHETLLHRRVASDMRLSRYGLRMAQTDVDRCALQPEGPPLAIYHDVARTAMEIEARSPRDVGPFLAFTSTLRRDAAVVATFLDVCPPRTEAIATRDVLTWLTAFRRLRTIGSRDAHQLCRWMSMAIGDVVEESFDDRLLQAVVAGPALVGTKQGPRSPGTALLLLLREAHRRLAGGTHVALGGPGAITSAMAGAARNAGARIEVATPVDRILVDGNRVRGVVAGGREYAADLVVSAIDPKTTWWLADMPEADPAATIAFGQYRASGTLAKINLALSALPSFSGTSRAMLTGRIQIGPTIDELERAFDAAKYGNVSSDPWLDMALPSLVDPELAPPGAHVASIYAHYVPRDLSSQDWNTTERMLLQRVLARLEQYAPGIASLVVAADVVTPRVLQREYGFAGGHVYHGELAADQLFAMRPIFGYGRYRTPVQGLYLCSAGTHPGGFMTGASGRLAAIEVVRDLRSGRRRKDPHQNASLRQ